ICGVAMGALAIALHDQGYHVTGSDKEFYPPISTMLEDSGIQLFRGYDANHVVPSIDMAIIGNSVSVGNDEVQAVGKHRIPHTFFAKIAGELLLHDRTSIVVSGTHGKTTTTSLVAYALQTLKRNPSYFIGGQVSQLPSSFCFGAGAEGVIEGDEYDSVFYVKRPKFLFYPPTILVVNALEFDHADIYADLAAIEREFDELLLRVPIDGSLIACIDFPAVRELLERYRNVSNGKARLLTFGESADAMFRLQDVLVTSDRSSATVIAEGERFQISTLLPGVMNLRNVLASVLVGRQLGIPPQAWVDSITDFQGASRRFQKCFEGERVTLLEDFAHHPTAVREVIRSLLAAFPNAQHWVAFEPRSNTSRRNLFQAEYGESFKGIQRLFIREITTRPSDEGQALLDLSQLSKATGEYGTICTVHRDGEEILSVILEALSQTSEQVVITIMSNGGFDGLPARLTQALQAL
ncbi:MAG: hypothetical protein KDD60_05055, partial [Bdellovibrionales bacterium]|nr:hypothetical protein [Bdellovibrionales bacterium]